MARIALIEDDRPVSDRYRDWILKALPQAQIDQLFTREEAEAAIVKERYDLVLLDIGIGHQPNAGVGIAVLIGSVRPLPILVVSAHPASVYRSIMKEVGVWDYLQKTMFDESEFIEVLIDMLRAAKSRPATDRLATSLTSGVTWDGKRIVLPLTASKFLSYLYEHRDRDVTYDELKRFTKSSRTLETIRKHIENIQNAFEEIGEKNPIQNVRMVGYRWRLADNKTK